jgi:hypothetical protein
MCLAYAFTNRSQWPNKRGSSRYFSAPEATYGGSKRWKGLVIAARLPGDLRALQSRPQLVTAPSAAATAFCGHTITKARGLWSPVRQRLMSAARRSRFTFARVVAALPTGVRSVSMTLAGGGSRLTYASPSRSQLPTCRLITSTGSTASMTSREMAAAWAIIGIEAAAAGAEPLSAH